MLKNYFKKIKNIFLKYIMSGKKERVSIGGVSLSVRDGRKILAEYNRFVKIPGVRTMTGAQLNAALKSLKNFVPVKVGNKYKFRHKIVKNFRTKRSYYALQQGAKTVRAAAKRVRAEHKKNQMLAEKGLLKEKKKMKKQTTGSKTNEKQGMEIKGLEDANKKKKKAAKSKKKSKTLAERKAEAKAKNQKTFQHKGTKYKLSKNGSSYVKHTPKPKSK